MRPKFETSMGWAEGELIVIPLSHLAMEEMAQVADVKGSILGCSVASADAVGQLKVRERGSFGQQLLNHCPAILRSSHTGCWCKRGLSCGAGIYFTF